MQEEEVKKNLELFNDDNFKFDSSIHRYVYGVNLLTPVTTLIKEFSTPFNEEYWSERKAKEYGKTANQLKDEWRFKNLCAIERGTNIHIFIEEFLSGQIVIPFNKSCLRFIEFYNLKLKNFKVLAIEKRIFSKKFTIAGTIDSIFYNNNKLYIIDWKTNENFKDNTNCYPKNLKYPFNNLMDNDLNKYSIQLSLYSLILEEVDIFIDSMIICHISEDKIQYYKALNLKNLLSDYLKSNYEVHKD